ncbi:MAG TPA: hypothetical protein VM029_20980, partial [Opitutaceae bacterium]|nr:hypothetical protein [Opitutaceae bacterium]
MIASGSPPGQKSGVKEGAASCREESAERAADSSRVAPVPPWVRLAIAVLALVALISRRPDMWNAPQFWAEDGIYFFKDAAAMGWRSWWVPCMGYLNLSSRTIACLTVSLPWEFIPLIYVWSAG